MAQMTTQPTRAAPVPGQRKTPPRLRSHTLLGSAGVFQRDPLGFLIKAGQLGDVVRLRFVFSPAYVVSHPDGVQRVLQEHHQNYNRDLPTYHLFRPFLGGGLILNDGDSWLHQRRLMQPAFHLKHLTTYASQMTAAAEVLLARWDARGEGDAPLNIAEEMMRLTLHILGQTMFSLDVSRQTDVIGPAITTLLALMGRYLYAPFPPLSVPTPRNRQVQQAIRTLNRVVYAMIDERRQQPTDRGDLLSMLLLARDADSGQGMTDQQVRDEVMTMLVAGHETTANTLAWAWYLLSQHPQVERRLHDELRAALGGRMPTLEDLPSLPYTRMVLEETLRLYPPGTIFSRKAIAADEVCGYLIPANSMLIISPYATQHHPGVWDQPETFDPERFTPERSATRPHYAYFPFGGGPHLCIGREFALLEAQLVLATIAQRYRLRLVPGRVVEPQFLVSLRPRDGLPMTLERR